MSEINRECITMVHNDKYALLPGEQIVFNLRNLLADTVIKMCPHPVTESVACEPCTHAAFVVRSA